MWKQYNGPNLSVGQFYIVNDLEKKTDNDLVTLIKPHSKCQKMKDPTGNFIIYKKIIKDLWYRHI